MLSEGLSNGTIFKKVNHVLSKSPVNLGTETAPGRVGELLKPAFKQQKQFSHFSTSLCFSETD